MRLWLLTRLDTDHWDIHLAFVVRAVDEPAARRAASQHAKGDHGGPRVWLDSMQSSCVEILTDGEPGIVLDSYQAG